MGIGGIGPANQVVSQALYTLAHIFWIRKQFVFVLRLLSISQRSFGFSTGRSCRRRAGHAQGALPSKIATATISTQRRRGAGGGDGGDGGNGGR